MRNVGASIKAKLKAQAKEKKISMHFMLIRYANERLLGRLELSKWSDRFCLKGGMLLPAFNEGEMFRPTSDMDLNGLEDGDLDTLIEMVRELAAMKPKSQGGNMDFDDGLVILEETIQPRHEVEDGAEGGKIEFVAMLDTSRIQMRIDVGFNKPITPGVNKGEYPSLLHDDKKSPMPRPQIKMYPPETMVAEKMHAIAQYGMFNTRIRDYYDLYTLLDRFDFEDEILSEALAKTFAKQGRDIPLEWPGLSPQYAEENESRWVQFNSNTTLKIDMPSLAIVVDRIRGDLDRALGIALNEPQLSC